MNPTCTLPSDYTFAWRVDLKRNLRLNLVLQGVGLVWFGLVMLLLWQAFSFLRPADEEMVIAAEPLLFVSGMLAVIAIAVTLHELVHGLAFWWFTRQIPKFGIGPGYAYAAMPGWYFPKHQYLTVGLAPLVGLTLLGLMVVPLLPNAWLAPFFVGLAMNAGGAIGDIYICLRIARERGDILIRDLGDGFEVYRRG
ncbi:MAG: DUF3267 domain-containing protein [Anaerolineales bacterium]|nr:DUF3267 domain-containing protein [Anaerolineales bacterium]MCX7756390.1 DUF3267 domain-containing protein [Anaerolineales bacterium]MDW8277062.1 DUF3267 domain-containing protein [Anaerolineales bacterium]